MITLRVETKTETAVDALIRQFARLIQHKYDIMRYEFSSEDEAEEWTCNRLRDCIDPQPIGADAFDSFCDNIAPAVLRELKR